MKKILAGLGLMALMSSPLLAGQVHYFQDVQMDKNAKFGQSASSSVPHDATLIFSNSNDDNKVILKSTGASSDFTLYLPTAAGNGGETLATDANGQLYWATQTASTLTVNEAVSRSLEAIANSSHTGITAAYTSPDTLNLSLSTSVLLDGQNINANVITASSMTATGSITASQFNGGSVNATTINASGDISTEAGVKINRDQQVVFDKNAGSNTYITNESATDRLEFYRNGVLYMAFE